MKRIPMVTFCACFLIFALLRYPQAMLDASAQGAELWLFRVLPSLFPFMAACGILLRMGTAEKAGAFLQPLMKPLFGLPGICAFPFFLGILSGYPMGAKITAMLYEKKLISKEDAAHVLVFSNNPGPLFLVGTVGAAFFHVPFLGYLLLLSVLLGSLATGIFWRAKKKKQTFARPSSYPSSPSPSPTAALSASVGDAMETLLQIGGYLMLFCALTEALKQTGLFSLLSHILSFLPCSEAFLQGLLGGILEMTNGASLLSAAPDALRLRLTATAFLVAFGGLSILGQSLGVLSSVPISKGDYIKGKLCNGIFSGFFFFLLYPFLEKNAQKAVPVFSLFPETAFSCSFFFFLPLLFFLGTLLFAFQKGK